jgi:hypothetical protein
MLRPPVTVPIDDGPSAKLIHRQSQVLRIDHTAREIPIATSDEHPRPSGFVQSDMRSSQQVEHAAVEVLQQRANAALLSQLLLPQPTPRIGTRLAETVRVNPPRSGRLLSPLGPFSQEARHLGM